MFITMAGIIGSLFGGVLMDMLSVHLVLGIGVALSLIGLLLCYPCLTGSKAKQAINTD